jgi:hypothetical protein
VDPRTQASAAVGSRNDPLAGVSLALGVASLPAYLCCGLFSLALNVVGLVLAIMAFLKAALVVNGLVLLLNIAMVGFFAVGMLGGGGVFP